MANKRPPLEMSDLTENLKNSKGRGADAFFPSPTPSTTNTSTPPVEKEKNNQPSFNDDESKSNNKVSNTTINKKINNETNILSNITILQITEKDVDELRELAEKPQTYRLTHQNIEYIKDVAYKLSKESKRGKIGQGDVLRIALMLFDKFITSNKADLKEILERIK